MLIVVFNKRMRWMEYVARNAEEINTYIILVGIPEGKEVIGEPRLRSEGNIKMDHKDTG
jgi:hypothetical protein